MAEGTLEPLTPQFGDLRDFPFTPLFRSRLFSSRFHARATDAEWRAGLTLWLKSWDQVPAGSLPTDDIDLCRLAELGRDLTQWAAVKAMALHGWVPCSDGLLYHPVVAEGVNDALSKKRGKPGQGRVGASVKWRTDLAQQNKQKRHERLAAGRRLGTHTTVEWLALVNFCGQKCLRCGRLDREIVKDHIVPLYQGGSDSIENLQPLCRACNAAKGPDDSDLRPSGWRHHIETNAFETPAAVRVTPAQAPAPRLQAPGNRQGERERQKEPSLRDGKKAAGRGTRIPDDWKLTEGLRGYAVLHGVDPDLAAEEFFNFWHSTTKNPTKLDWDRTFENRILELADRGKFRMQRSNGPLPSPEAMKPFTGTF